MQSDGVGIVLAHVRHHSLRALSLIVPAIFGRLHIREALWPISSQGYGITAAVSDRITPLIQSIAESHHIDCIKREYLAHHRVEVREQDARHLECGSSFMSGICEP